MGYVINHAVDSIVQSITDWLKDMTALHLAATANVKTEVHGQPTEYVINVLKVANIEIYLINQLR